MANVAVGDGEDGDVVAALCALDMDMTSYREGTLSAVDPLVAVGTSASWGLTEIKQNLSLLN